MCGGGGEEGGNRRGGHERKTCSRSLSHTATLCAAGELINCQLLIKAVPPAEAVGVDCRATATSSGTCTPSTTDSHPDASTELHPNSGFKGRTGSISAGVFVWDGSSQMVNTLQPEENVFGESEFCSVDLQRPIKGLSRLVLLTLCISL